jgi:hypothetical protein
MKKFAALLFYITLLGFATTVALNLLHFPLPALVVVAGSCCCLLYGVLISLVFQNNFSQDNLSMIAYRMWVTTTVLGHSGALILFIGLVVRWLGFSFAYWFSFSGFTLLFLFFIVTAYRVKKRARRSRVHVLAPGIPVSDLDIYVGTYSSEDLKMKITVAKNEAGDALVAQATGQEVFPLYFIEKNIFNFSPQGLIMEFKPENNKFVLIKHGGYFPFIKEA